LTEIREKRIDDFDAMLLGELFEVETNQGDKGALKDQPVEKPPEMAWVLIGIPLVRFSEISAAIEALADNPNTTISTTANNG
jgi:hypothetical protein